MERNELEAAATPPQLGAAVRMYQEELDQLHQHAHGGSTTERRVIYKGHDIRVTTTYQISVDGDEVTGHVLVNNQGSMHYHAIPNEEFASAIDLVKRIVDITDMPAPPAEPDPDQHHHHHGGQ